LFDRHTAENLYNLFCKFLNALYPDWHVKLLNTSSDDENTMIGRHAGLITCIARCAKFNVLRVWCASHQIDIIVKSSAESINGGTYVKDVYSFSVHLQSQHNLIIQMGIKCQTRLQLLQAVPPPDHCTHPGEAPREAAVGHVVGNHVRGGARRR
jgi:hypothetical protein